MCGGGGGGGGGSSVGGEKKKMQKVWLREETTTIPQRHCRDVFFCWLFPSAMVQGKTKTKRCVVLISIHWFSLV